MADDEDSQASDDAAQLLRPPGIPRSTFRKLGFPTCRHILTILAFLGFVNVYALRVNLSVALVAMVKQTNNDTNTSTDCAMNVQNSTTNQTQGEFSWSDTQQSLVLGAFFYGYITTQLLGGWMASMFGGKYLYGGGVLCTSLLTLLTPIAARTSFPMLIAVRVLEGVGEGVTFPAMHAMLGHWAPPLERSQMGAFIYSGAQLGTVISMPVSGLLCNSGFLGGWPSVFYVFGTLGCVWWIFWMIFVFDKPSKHPRISEAEKHFIEKAIGHQEERISTPWRSIFTSRAFWGILLAHTCNNYGYYTLLTCLPKYMSTVLQFDISQNGVLSGLPYLLAWLFMSLSGVVADKIRRAELLSTTTVRKLFNTCGMCLPAVFLVLTGYVGCDQVLAVVMISAAIGFAGISMAGYGVNHIDIAPPFAGSLMGLTNMAATVPGFVGPQVLALFIEHDKSRSQWVKVFYISSAIYVVGAICFLLLASGVEQPWAKKKQRQLLQAADDSEELDDNKVLTFSR